VKLGNKAGADKCEDIDPNAFLVGDQSIVYVGLVWKLNTGAKPEQLGEWCLRKLWLTSTGGLFYYSRQHDKPLGRPAAGLQVSSLDKKTKTGHYAFELVCDTTGSTVFAVETRDERDQWVKVLNEVKVTETDDLDPLEPFTGHGLHHERGRMLRQDESPEHMEHLSAGGEASYRLGGGFGPSIRHGASGDLPTASLGLGGANNQLDVMRMSRVAMEVALRASVGPSIFSENALMGKQTVTKSKAKAPISAELMKENTCIIFDWDDTLFPTTWIREDCGLNWRYTIAEQVEPSARRDVVEDLLAKYSVRACTFFKEACSLGHVAIVTLAKKPWVHDSMKKFMPELMPLMEQHKIKVLYARDHITKKMQQEYAAQDFKTGNQEINFWMRAKASAMKEELEAFYGSRKMPWKNVVCIGDSDIERTAVLTISDEYAQDLGKHEGKLIMKGLTSEVESKDGQKIRLRTKVLKMLDEPSVEELTAEIFVMTDWLPQMVRQDEGFNVQLDSTDENTVLNMLCKTFTGKEGDLSWEELADAEVDPTLKSNARKAVMNASSTA